MKFFIDFDGTITKNDVVDMMLERFASDEWRAVEKEWVEGKIGSRECLSKQTALVKVSQEDLRRFLKTIEIDTYFTGFLKTAQSFSVPVSIVSDGFRFVIDSVLQNSFQIFPDLLHHVPVFSNEIRWRNGKAEASFPDGVLCERSCANCKARILRENNPDGDFVIFAGDGLSDRFAAKTAALTFAKGKLLKFCQENQIEHIPYSSFKDIENWILTIKGTAIKGTAI